MEYWNIGNVEILGLKEFLAINPVESPKGNLINRAKIVSFRYPIRVAQNGCHEKAIDVYKLLNFIGV